MPASSFLRRDVAAVLDQLLGLLLVGDGVEAPRPPRARRRGRAPRPASTGRPRSSVAALVVEHRAHLADVLAGDDGVADLQRAVLHEHRRHRAAVAVELGLDDGAACAGLFGLALSSSTSACSAIISSSWSMPSLVRADTSTKMVSPPHSSGMSPCSESCWRMRSGCAPGLSILLTATMIGTFGVLGVVDRLDGRRHDAVVGRDHQDDDVGRLRAAGAHGGERLVARRVEEDDVVAARRRDLVGADVLGDAARLARGDVGVADGVEQRGLAVVDVAHDGDHRRARHRDPPACPRPARRRRRPPGRRSISISKPNSVAISVAVSWSMALLS